MPNNPDCISISRLKDRDGFYLMKSLIHNEEYWKTMSEYVKVWMDSPSERETLESKYNYELALLSVTHEDLDRARFFLSKEKDLFLKSWRKFN